MGTIFICGDNHGHFRHLIEAVREHRPTALISVGDLVEGSSPRTLTEELKEILDLTEFWWVPGNHDTDDDAAYDATFGSSLGHRNLHGRVVTIAGVRVAGLGGLFRAEVWLPPAKPLYGSAAEYARKGGKSARWRNGISRRHRSTIFPDVYARLADQRAEVLITHEAPSCHPHGNAALTKLAQAMRVRSSFHGHHHDCINYSSGWTKLGFKPFGVGLRGISTIEGQVVVAGLKDQERGYRRPVL